jgi:DNA-binding protein H-NS
VDSSSPLAALGDNAEEIIGQVRKLIKKQRQIEAERQALAEERDEMAQQIQALEAERDELVQRLTDAVVRMEELVELADAATMAAPQPAASTPPRYSGGAALADQVDHVERSAPPAVVEPPPYAATADTAGQDEDFPPADPFESSEKEDTSLAARIQQAEREEPAANGFDADSVYADDDPVGSANVFAADDRSFYDRHSAKLPRLEGDGGRSVLSAIGGMRPETEAKGRKGRRRKKEK